MSIQRVRKKCGRCGTNNSFVVAEISLRVDDDEGEPTLLCYRCCKKRFWPDEKRCNHCSEITMCKELFLPNLKAALKKTEGI